MKRILPQICSILLLFSLTACGVGKAHPPATTPSVPSPPITQDAEVPTDEYQLGQIVSNTEHISEMNGVIQIEATGSNEPSAKPTAPAPTVPEENIMRSIQITVGNKTFSATLEENDAAHSFMQLLQSAPVVIQMNDYSGFEKVGSLGSSLPESNRHISAQSGDIILYNGNQIVVFYGSNSWSYTKLGRIDDLSGWQEALGNGDVTLTFSIQ